MDDESKLTLHGLVQHYIMLHEEEKNRKLTDLLDALDFNQVVIFVKNVARATELNRLLNECNFPSICIHSRMNQVRGGVGCGCFCLCCYLCYMRQTVNHHMSGVVIVALSH